MHESIVTGLVLILALGTACQWIAVRFRLPSILLLLIAGFVAGPVTGWLAPDEVLGDMTFPVVSLAAAIVLFEGGLTASWGEMRRVATPVWRLVTIGLVATWAATTAAACLVLGFSFEMGLLLGAILVVTGPTVIGPLLRHVKPSKRVASIAKLEGILNDPIGAVLAILVYQAIRADEVEHAFAVVAGGVVLSLVTGVVLGVGGARALVVLIRRELVPEELQPSLVLVVLLGTYAAANAITDESGLLAVTLMGVSLASQDAVDVDRITRFKEHLRVILVPALFVVLAARIEMPTLTALPLSIVTFVAIVLLVRLLATGIATIGTELSWRERSFLAGLAPRGIVAAAVASVFGMRLEDSPHAGAGLLMPVTFAVIATTVTLYGLGALPLSRVLGLRRGQPDEPDEEAEDSGTDSADSSS